jgi:glycosyltransferase involved in cell wall biosynthesis
MTDSLRVLALIESTKVTGPAKNLLQFAQLARQGVEGAPRVEVELAVFWRPGDSSVLVDAAAAAEVTVHRIPEKGRFDRSVMPALADLLRRLRPDVLQSHAVKSHFLVRYSGLHRRYPWVAFQHGYTATDLRNTLYNQLDRWSLRAAQRVVVVSGQFRDRLVRQWVPRERIAVIHNAIDPRWAAAARHPEAAAALRAKLGIAADEKVLLIAARLSKEKDHTTLLRALADLRAKYREAPRLIVLGDGPERSHIDAAIASLGLTGQVILPGWEPSEPYYGIADVAVLSSVVEGSPNAVLEAIGGGVPVVATAVGGIPEIVTDGESALLAPPGDPSRLAEALHAVLTSPGLAERLAARGREIAAARHSPEARVRAICEVYRELRPVGDARLPC